MNWSAGGAVFDHCTWTGANGWGGGGGVRREGGRSTTVSLRTVGKVRRVLLHLKRCHCIRNICHECEKDVADCDVSRSDAKMTLTSKNNPFFI